MNTIIERGKVMPFEAMPHKSIALDGYVQGPAVDTENQRFSFDHHDKCLRIVTSATCKQVLDAVLLGLEPDQMTSYINDIDGDTVMAEWLLRNPARAYDLATRTLVETVGAIDAHGPAYPVAYQDLSHGFYGGVMQPEQALRRAGEYGTADLGDLLEKCVGNVSLLLAGKLDIPERPVDTRTYEVTYEGAAWVMAKSADFIFDKLYADGHTRAVAYQEMPDGSYGYTVAKKSELVSGFKVGPHSVPGTILHALSEVEPGWGGGSTIGGAPRNPDGSRSHLSPETVRGIVESVTQN